MPKLIRSYLSLGLQKPKEQCVVFERNGASYINFTDIALILNAGSSTLGSFWMYFARHDERGV